MSEELSKDFRFDLSLLLEQLEREGILLEDLSNTQRRFIDDLLDSTVDSLLDILNSYDTEHLAK